MKFEDFKELESEAAVKVNILTTYICVVLVQLNCILIVGLYAYSAGLCWVMQQILGSVFSPKKNCRNSGIQVEGSDSDPEKGNS